MVNMTMKVDQLVIEEPTLHEFPPNFVWNNLYKRHFIEQLQNKDIIIQLDTLTNDIKNNTDIDYAVEKFKEICSVLLKSHCLREDQVQRLGRIQGNLTKSGLTTVVINSY